MVAFVSNDSLFAFRCHRRRFVSTFSYLSPVSLSHNSLNSHLSLLTHNQLSLECTCDRRCNSTSAVWRGDERTTRRLSARTTRCRVVTLHSGTVGSIRDHAVASLPAGNRVQLVANRSRCGSSSSSRLLTVVDGERSSDAAVVDLACFASHRSLAQRCVDVSDSCAG